MARPKQSILKRDADGNVVYDAKGRPVVERVVKASRSDFRRSRPAQSSAVVTRTMTAEEREQYGQPATHLSHDERKRIGQAALLDTASERRFHSRE